MPSASVLNEGGKGNNEPGTGHRGFRGNYGVWSELSICTCVPALPSQPRSPPFGKPRTHHQWLLKLVQQTAGELGGLISFLPSKTSLWSSDPAKIILMDAQARSGKSSPRWWCEETRGFALRACPASSVKPFWAPFHESPFPWRRRHEIGAFSLPFWMRFSEAGD
jgi:hypothetical protein